MIRLDRSLILKIHDEQIHLHGGQSGIRDRNLFLSECEMPYQTFEGIDLFPDLYDKAVRYLFGFASNQVFLDGNKRTAVMTMLIFLSLNGIELDVTDDDLIRLGLDVSNGLIHEAQVKDLLLSHTIWPA